MLSFELVPDGSTVEIHANAEGCQLLIEKLSMLCGAGDGHDHLLSPGYGGEELSLTPVGVQNSLIHHVKVMVWDVSPPQAPGDKRAEGARADGANRDVFEPSPFVSQARSYNDTQTGNTVYAEGSKVVVLTPSGRLRTSFRDTDANTINRIRSGRWVPLQ